MDKMTEQDCKSKRKKRKWNNSLFFFLPQMWATACGHRKKAPPKHTHGHSYKRIEGEYSQGLAGGPPCPSKAALGFTCTSSLHSLSEAGGDSAKSGNSSLVLGPRKRILSRRFSMVNTAHLGFTLTWRTATLQGQKTQFVYNLFYQRTAGVYLFATAFS